MRIVEQSFEIEDLGAENGLEILKKIERAGRTCYKSENKITEDSAARFVRGIIKSGHHSVIEHHNIVARIITNRGVTHEIVRHRLAAYSQESTRYCNYGGKEMEFIRPVWIDKIYNIDNGIDEDLETIKVFLYSLLSSELDYKRLLDLGWTPQQAREVLPNALKTEIVVTANLREWWHIFTLRCSPASHPQMIALMKIGLYKMNKAIPVIFEDLAEMYLNGME